MRLQTIILINRAPFKHLELNFDHENVTVLAGINGSGKTTIIAHIADSFYELAKHTFFNEFENKEHKFYRISSDLDSLDRSKGSIVYLRYILDDETQADYIDIRGIFTQENYDDMLAIPDKIPFSLIESTLKQNKVNKFWSLTNNDAILAIFSNSLMTYFPAYRYEVPSFLNEAYNFKLSFKKSSDFAGFLFNPIEVTSDLPQIANWIMDVVLDFGLYKGKVSTLFNNINDVLTKILISKHNCRTRIGIGPRTSGASRVSVEHRDLNNIQIYPSIFNMSSGELALLCLFGELVKQTDRLGKIVQDISGIVLVDEIDKHLHIRLQKEILPKLILMFPNLQFIVTSHSPFFGLGLAESTNLSYTIYDMDNNGIPCLPQDNELFKEVYKIMIKQNEQYYAQYKRLQEKMKNDTRPLIITEGKTDWKHLKAAMKALAITELNIEFLENEEDSGYDALEKLLMHAAKIQQPRIIIGVFDRDVDSVLKWKELGANEYIHIQNNVYAFAIPLVNEDVYHTQAISIEHYYKKVDLTKETDDGRRIYLGSEFYSSGISKDSKYLTRCKGIDRKATINAVIDEKVYDIANHPEGRISVALSKDDFANKILSQDRFTTGFDFEQFRKIFDIIEKIIMK